MVESSHPVALAIGEGAGLGDGWVMVEVTVEPRGQVMVQLRRERDEASVEILVTAPGAATEALATTPLGNIAYRAYSGLSDQEVAEVTRSFAEHFGSGKIPLVALFPHLAVETGVDRPPGETRAKLEGLMAEHSRLLPGTVAREGALALPETQSSLFLDPPGIAEFLAPQLVIDGPPIGGYTLSAIYLPPLARRESPDFDSYVLEFSHAGDFSAIHIVLGTRGAFPQVFGHAGSLAVGVRHFGQGEQDALGAEQAQLCSWVVALLEMKQGVDFELTVPAGAQQVRALSLPAHKAAALDLEPGDAATATLPERRVLNLSIDAECGQECTFCSVKSYLKPEDGGEDEFERIKIQLRKARADGIYGVRINGIDPLAFSKILETVEAIEDLGFQQLSVYTTGRRFAEPAFRKEFLERFTSELYIVIPVYGITAEVHDRVVGREGAHGEAMTALEGLLAETRPGQVAISTVVVQQNVHQFNQLTAYAFERNIMLEAHLPYPMRQTTRDPYAESALPEDEVVRRFVDTLDEVPVGMQKDAARWLGHMIRHPCLLWEAEFAHGLPLFGTRALGTSAYMDGTDYRRTLYAHASQVRAEESAFAAATVPCPHLDDCALSSVCPGEHYALYQELFGLDAFKPVTVQNLYGTLLEYKVTAAHEESGKVEAELSHSRTKEQNGKLRTVASATIGAQNVQIKAMQVLAEFEPAAQSALDETHVLVRQGQAALEKKIQEAVDGEISLRKPRALWSGAVWGARLRASLQTDYEENIVRVLAGGLEGFGQITQALQEKMGSLGESVGFEPPPMVKAMGFNFDESDALRKIVEAVEKKVSKTSRKVALGTAVGLLSGILLAMVSNPMSLGVSVGVVVGVGGWALVSLASLRLEVVREVGALVRENTNTLVGRVEKAWQRDWDFHRSRCADLFARLGMGQQEGDSPVPDEHIERFLFKVIALQEGAQISGNEPHPLLPEDAVEPADGVAADEMPEIAPFESILSDLRKMNNQDENQES